MTWVEPLNLEMMFVNTLSGGATVFAFLAFVMIAGICARFKMPNTVTLSMFALFGLVFAEHLGPIPLLVILLGGLISFFSLKKITE